MVQKLKKIDKEWEYEEIEKQERKIKIRDTKEDQQKGKVKILNAKNVTQDKLQKIVTIVVLLIDT